VYSGTIVAFGAFADKFGRWISDASREAILDMLAALANEWRWLAIAWHVAFVTAGVVAFSRWSNSSTRFS
jgi:hypothetical protein